MKRIVIDCTTGLTSEEELDPDDVASLEAVRLQSDARQQETATRDTERTAATTDLGDAVTAAMTRLDAIISGGGAYTATEVRSAVVDMARVQKRLLRYLAARLSG